jgi:acyl-CoA hydrolase
MSQSFDDVAECVETTIARLGQRIVLALPLGIGKPAAIANEFWRRALRDPSLQLTIITALSLRKPPAASDLERRFAAPLYERIFGDYEELDYLRALHSGTVPVNARVIEFFLEPGGSLNVALSQQNYLSANYTHVARELVAHGVNVVAHLVAKRSVAGEAQFSLGSNTDVTLDLTHRRVACGGAGCRDHRSAPWRDALHGRQRARRPGVLRLPAGTAAL